MKFQKYLENPYNVINKEIIDKVASRAYELGKEVTIEGELATYIPELSKADINAFGLCIKDLNGNEYCYGDVNTRFSIQSVGKVILLALALKLKRKEKVFSHVLAEPSGDSFNSIIKLDTISSLPFNPMINAGAIQIVSLILDEVSFADFLNFAQEICLDKDINLNEDVYHSEALTGNRNRAISYLLASKNDLLADPMQSVDFYFKMCSLNVNAKSLAGLGLVLANNGIDPKTKKVILEEEHVKLIKSIMFTCGLYDASGEYAMKVGIPSKTGVGGGLTGASSLKGLGFGCYGPSLDKHGNSIAAMTAMEYISYMLRLHVFEN